MNRSFVRKIIYMVAMVALLFPLSWLSRPATVGVDGAQGSDGGELAQKRAEYGLTKANLGEIDPTGETIKLATVGMGGVAANLLWTKATEYQMKEDWTNLSATLEQISRLQPHFISVWRYQGWNLSYNVAVEWDDYRQRYEWVKKGIHFLQDGQSYNRKEAVLPWDVGWFYGHKMGTADEKRLYRALLRKDDDEMGSRPLERRDNWLVGRDALIEAQEIVDNEGGIIRGTNPLLFHSGPSKWQINYAAALEEDGGLDGQPVFAERARVAWERGLKEWEAYGDRPIDNPRGIPLRLAGLERHQQQLNSLTEQIKQLANDVYTEIEKEKRASLTPEEKASLDIPDQERDDAQLTAAAQAAAKLAISNDEIAARVKGEHRAKVRQLTAEANRHAEIVRSTNTARDIVQYEYWRRRCLAERTPETIAARELMHRGLVAYRDEADLVTARKAYEESFEKWRVVMDKFPRLKSDRVVGDDLVGPEYLPGGIRVYEKVLKQLDEEFPKDFILQDVIIANNPDPPIGK